MASKDCIFSVKSFYDNLENTREGQFPRKMVWNPCVPMKVSFLVWQIWWEKVLRMDQLKKINGHTPCQQMSQVWEGARELRSSTTPMCEGSGSVGFSVCHLWYQLGSSKFS